MALEKAFVEEFWNNTHMNYPAFHAAVADRATELDRQRLQQQQQQLQHQFDSERAQQQQQLDSERAQEQQQLDSERAQLQHQYQLAMQQLGSSSSSTAPATAPDGDVDM